MADPTYTVELYEDDDRSDEDRDHENRDYEEEVLQNTEEEENLPRPPNDSGSSSMPTSRDDNNVATITKNRDSGKPAKVCRLLFRIMLCNFPNFFPTGKREMEDQKLAVRR